MADEIVIGIFETQEQKYSPADLTLFFENLEPQIPLGKDVSVESQFKRHYTDSI